MLAAHDAFRGFELGSLAAQATLAVALIRLDPIIDDLITLCMGRVELDGPLDVSNADPPA
jgi:hypothetical protein